MSWWIAAALAQAPGPLETSTTAPSDEIIVWGDPFLRWDRRWYVETEVRFGSLFRLLADNNLESRLGSVQMRVVLDCDRDFQLGPQRWEVRCLVEDIALIGRTSRPGRDDDRVLREADAALTGAELQLQVSAEGGVPNVDVEGLAPDNHRDRSREEQYRQLLSRVILPFHLGLPPVVADGVKWYEYNSRLMSMPSAQASAGGTQIAHFLDVFEGRLLVQSMGEGHVVPQGGGGIGEDANTGQAVSVGGNGDIYQTKLHAVAIFDRETGIMEERVWAFGGELTASSPNMLRGLSYGHRGHLRMLGDKDRPDVGLTYLARNTVDDEGAAPLWVPME